MQIILIVNCLYNLKPNYWNKNPQQSQIDWSDKYCLMVSVQSLYLTITE